MSDVQTEAEAIFARYLIAWNGRDFESIAECFDEPCQFIQPAATIGLADRPSLVVMLADMASKLEAEGFDRTEIERIEARTCNDGLALVELKGVARLRADGSALEIMDAHYIMRRTDAGWRLCTAIACQRGWDAT